ncbi:MAG: chorismate mutase [Tissierellia bacterium]|nr:chorismate mutase [Tissierellia bacterium]
MDNLDTLRDEIDDIDRKITDLFEQRMDIVKKIIDYKTKNNIKILDQSRENYVVKKNVEYLNNPEYSSYLEDLFIEIMGISRDFQSKITQK